VAISDTALTSVISVNPGTSSASYTAWVTPVETPSPSLAATVPPLPATEDVAWEWAPQFDHPDPDAVITLTAPLLPAWLTISGNVLTGTPLQAHAGTGTIRLRATDAAGKFVERNFTVAVMEVNDLPAGFDTNVSVDEDAPPVTVDLTPLFSDEETADGSLGFQIAGYNGDTVTPVVTGSTLQLQFPANANGSASVVVRATDAGGLTADSVVSVAVSPVNDVPAGSLDPVAMDEDAAPLVIDLGAAFSDVESPDAELTWSILSQAPAGIAAAGISGASLTIAPLPDANGDFTVVVRCADSEGLSIEVPLAVTLRAVNDPPAFPAALPDVNAGPAAPDATIDLSPLLRDPDSGDTRTWRVAAVSNPDIFDQLIVDAAGRLGIRYAPYRSGDADVTVEVTDAAGASGRLTFRVTLPELPAPEITVSSALTLNRQTGLWEHRITLRNDAVRAIGGFEVTVTNLPAGACLYNASECSAAAQLAGYYAPVAPGESVTMVLEYYNPSRAPLDPRLSVSTALPQTPPPPDSGGLAIDRIIAINGGLLLEFTAIPGHLYVVQYSDDNILWRDAQVRIRAAGNRVQWLDQGPPRTMTPPLQGGQRFYRVREVTGP
jgi:hypothetical protein